MKKILLIFFLSLIHSSISYSGELKAKVIDVKSWPDTAILCNYDTNDQSFMRGFNKINDDILGEFTSVHSFIDNNYWSPIESIVTNNDPRIISWYETNSEMTFFYFFKKDSLSKEYFKAITNIYVLSDQDKQFLSDMKLTKSTNKKSLAEKYAQTDDAPSREYTIGISEIVKKIRDQEEKMRNNSAYKKYELTSSCKVWK